MKNSHWDVIVIGSGMGALSCASLLANEGKSVLVLEQNYLPGGCTSSYWRKGFVFESGATTLVGLDEGMPLHYILQKTGIEVSTRKLNLPMEVRLPNGSSIRKYQNLEDWISEAERSFGKTGQREFWEFCFRTSQFVWDTSLKQVSFPPSNFSDLGALIRNISIDQLNYSRYAFYTMEWLLKKFNLQNNLKFKQFLNEQLLITAQNHLEEVNVLFGATALCYTNFGNYYVDGGLLNLVNPFIEFIERQGGELSLRNPVLDVQDAISGYKVCTKNGDFTCDFVISGIPVNDTIPLFQNGIRKEISKKTMPSDRLNSAFQMGIGFKGGRFEYNTIHYQVHLDEPLPGTGSNSFFLSLNHEEDHSRCDDPTNRVGSISTHIPNPEKNIFDKTATELAILEVLEKQNLIHRDDIIYRHSSTQKSWNKWTGRSFGFVGGYPQFRDIKPWQMNDARLDGKKAYICGDTTYPGQGIPGVALSGIIAYEKLKQDWF